LECGDSSPLFAESIAIGTVQSGDESLHSKTAARAAET
jgi:hypothetical protein